MLVGLISDTHDRVPAAAALLAKLSERGVGLVLHAGDYCSPFLLNVFADAGLTLAGVFGRNDGDHEGLRAAASKLVGAELYESPHSMLIEEHRVLLVHDLGEVNGRSLDAHAIVVHGCSHLPDTRTRGDALIVNPGEGCGWLYGTPTAAVLDLDTRRVEQISLDPSEWRS